MSYLFYNSALIRIIPGIFMIIGMLSPFQPVNAQSDSVHAILFYSPSCPHCHKVINEDLPPLMDNYGEKLIIIGINVSIPEGQELYQAAIKRFNIPENRIGVPSLIVGDTVLVGSHEIPSEFPKIIDMGLDNGGIDWPDVPGLASVIAVSEEDALNNDEQHVRSNNLEPNSQGLTVLQKYTLDPVGNTIAVIVLLVMLGSLLITVYLVFSNTDKVGITWSKWIIPIFAAIGLCIAGYLSYIEITHTEALCGPVGNCNAVQQSPYAVMFGVLPIGILGILGYILIIIVWTIQFYGPSHIRKIATLSLWYLAFFGVLFSTYLTFLEPFVIGATCAWCLTSALLMTAILWAASGPASLAVKHRQNMFAFVDQI